MPLSIVRLINEKSSTQANVLDGHNLSVIKSDCQRKFQNLGKKWRGVVNQIFSYVTHFISIGN